MSSKPPPRTPGDDDLIATQIRLRLRAVWPDVPPTDHQAIVEKILSATSGPLPTDTLIFLVDRIGTWHLTYPGFQLDDFQIIPSAITGFTLRAVLKRQQPIDPPSPAPPLKPTRFDVLEL